MGIGLGVMKWARVEASCGGEGQGQMCVHRVLELTDEESLQLKSFILKSGFSNRFKGQKSRDSSLVY